MPEAAIEPRPEAEAAAGPGGAPEPVLALAGIVKHWPSQPTPVLGSVDLRLEPSCAVAISGRNGAGKTTLLRIAAGLIAPEQGTVRACGLDVEHDRTEFQRRIGFLAAGNSGLYARLKVENHLELWARLALMPKRERGPAVKEAIETFDLDPILGRRVDRLSMGQRQRLRLALAFVHSPAVVMLDEPATSLDEQGIALLQRALDSLKSRGGAALVCLPSGWEQLLSIDRSLVLSEGNLEPA
ncbi:MAG: type transport system ATP-binding protein [Thermoleophilaceae bacterium]|jgi:ABC-2 type transport system ATP-binding protein|nr:type transport system ATP-binding protein [Thermoleophilaceae bacterium]